LEATRWLRPPRLRGAAQTEERHATWLELFFDLVFVVAVAQLSGNLEHDPTLAGVGWFVALFVPVFWAWMGYTYYANRFDTDDVAFRVAMLTGMLAIAAFAVTIPQAHGHGSAQFALAYVAVRAVLIGLYVRAWRHVAEARDLCRRFVIFFGAGAGLWLASLLVPTPGRYALWALAIGVELAGPLGPGAGAVIRRTPFNFSHIPERFGLFTMIVLGESVVLVTSGLAATDWRPGSVATAAGCFVTVSALWWLYFDFVDVSVVRRSVPAVQLYLYGHLPILVGLTATGAGASLLLKAASSSWRWVYCGGLALYLVSISVIHLTTRRSLRDSVLATRLAIAALACVLAALGGALPAFAVVAVLAAALAAEVVHELAVEHRHQATPAG
jgi:low temperature requirement protein LtrA